ncbi:MAG TPA: PAS domain S-box protein [Dehalococcoidia bacterium]|nr:PAS domain S-box protein [Dehalococcoidia bacterium]
MEDKTREQLIEEIELPRREVAELKQEKAGSRGGEELYSERDKFQVILSAVNAGVDIVKQDFVIEYQNEFLVQRFGDQRGEKCYVAYMNRDKPCVFCRIQEIIKTGKPQRVELVAPDGRDYELSSSRFVDVDGQTKVIEVVRDFTECKKVEEELIHLNLVLLAIRSVNQLIAREKDRKKLIQGICSGLIETRGYDSAWIALVDEKGGLVYAAQEGVGKDFSAMVDRLKRGELPGCIDKAAVQSDMVVMARPAIECSGCPLVNICADKATMIARLECEGHTYGYVNISIPPEMVTDEERSLFAEMAGDISFALHDIQMEEERKEAIGKLEEAKALESSILIAIPHAVIGLHERRIIFANDSVEAVFGWKPGELIGKTTKVLYRSEEEYEQIGQRCYSALEQQRVHSEEIPCRRKDGRDIICQLSGSIIGEKLEEKRIVVTYEDITERKKVEETLQESEEKYRELIESMSEGLVAIDEKGILNFVNSKLCQMLGYKHGEIVGKHVFDFFDSKNLKILKRELAKRPKGISSQYEISWTAKSGRRVPTFMSAVPIFDAAGTHCGAYAVILDFTELKRAGSELKASEENFRSSLDSSPLGVRILSTEGETLYVNQVLLDIWGYGSLEELEAVPRRKRYTPESYAGHHERKEKRKLGEFVPPHYETSIVRKDGGVRYLEVFRKGVRWDGKTQFQVLYHDITERKEVEEALRESEKHLKTILDYVQSGIIVVDVETHKIVDANPSAIEMFGVPKEQVIGFICHRYICPAEVGQCPITDLGQSVNNSERVLLKANGESVPILKTVIPIIFSGRKHLLESFVDITERKKAEEQLERSFVELAETVSRAIATRDPYTAGHQRRVAELARLVGDKMGLDKDRLMGLYIGGLLHDIGKVSTPASILSKPGKLSDEEWALVRAHTREGHEILDGAYFPWPVVDMALHHHERLDGSGYPDGISGDELSLENRILGVCDVVEAMSSFRPYRPARSLPEILIELRAGKGTKYDPDVVDIMLEIIESGEYELKG